jgi:hypothetical protein
MDLVDQAENVRNRQDLAILISDLVDDLRSNKQEWENDNLLDFLEAMSRWVQDMDGYFMNRGEPIPTDKPWKLFADILMAARIYE